MTTITDAENMEAVVKLLHETKLAFSLVSGQMNAAWQGDAKTRDAHLKDFRDWRMAMDCEIHKLIASCSDVRKFFLSDNHEKEITRLKEFIDLCERLQKLKECGMLDSVADVILKLEKV